MSLDVNLRVKGEGEVFSSNITHNLGKMAAACGVYYACGIVTGKQIGRAHV